MFLFMSRVDMQAEFERQLARYRELSSSSIVLVYRLRLKHYAFVVNDKMLWLFHEHIHPIYYLLPTVPLRNGKRKSSFTPVALCMH
mmetsp:Transcript_24287/g.32258  ORF Transcript_24287/g.32258 Transcript_24287/m.32258 type:complete len:86 (-) Transcript_24287:188-445(-)